jgi:hypothetical protein
MVKSHITQIGTDLKQTIQTHPLLDNYRIVVHFCGKIKGKMQGKMTLLKRLVKCCPPGREAKTAGTTPTTGCVIPPGGVGVERRRRHCANCRSVPPKRPRSGPAGRHRGIFPTFCSHTTSPGGLTQPVVGVVPAILAPWPGRAPPGPAVDPPARAAWRGHVCTW